MTSGQSASHFHLMAGMTTGRLVRLAARKGLSWRPRQLARFVCLLLLSLGPTLLARIESLGYRKVLGRTPAPRDPIIILGHWRTGSTFLHQLMQLDPALAAPTLLQCCLPDSFLWAGRFAEPVMARLLAPTRPMDNVRVSPREPHEDEFALLRMTGNSPLEDLFFNRSDRYFLRDRDGCYLDETRAGEWEAAMLLFVTKVHLAAGKRIVLKNPFHSMRIPRLVRLFPEARFIHIVRDPRVVIPSTARMWSIVGAQNCLGGPYHPPRLEEVAEVFDRVLTRVRHDLADLSPGRACEVRFEELEADPLAVLRHIYGRLGMPLTPQYTCRVREFLATVSDYRKNSYAAVQGQRELISSRLRGHMEHYGYR